MTWCSIHAGRSAGATRHRMATDGLRPSPAGASRRANSASCIQDEMLLGTYALLNESQGLEEVAFPCVSRLIIDRNCLVVTPPHQAANRLRELAAGVAAHGDLRDGRRRGDAGLHRLPRSIPRAKSLGDRAAVKRYLLTIRDLKIAQIGRQSAHSAKDPRAAKAFPSCSTTVGSTSQLTFTIGSRRTPGSPTNRPLRRSSNPTR